MKFNPSFKIENRTVGIGKPVFVIAEIGVNHNGNLALAKRMVDAAKKCGVDCVKFQTFRAEEFLADPNQIFEYRSRGKKVREKAFDMFKRLELPDSWHGILFRYARSKGLIPLTSVADPQSADLAKKAGCGALKLSSEDFINLPLIEHVSKMKMPLLLSTGMALTDEMDDVQKILRRNRCANVMLLHCVSVYPTADPEANLARIRSLQEKFKAPTGYSDHTLGIEAAIGSVALGACAIEKHFTSNRDLAGPDQALSSDPKEMAALVRAIRRMERMRGNGDLNGSPAEKKSRLVFRRSIVAVRDLPKGHRIRRADLALKRPGDGLKARSLQSVIGKRLTKAHRANQKILTKNLKK